MKKILFALLSVSLLSGFSRTKSDDGVWVQFHNTMPDNLTDTYMYFKDEHQTFVGDIPAGNTTDYNVARHRRGLPATGPGPLHCEDRQGKRRVLPDFI